MDAKECILTRRSIRKYKPDPIKVKPLRLSPSDIPISPLPCPSVGPGAINLSDTKEIFP